ncbi:uncharacterized protein N7515_003072 [Penicillium bovifimosum]|uniref:Uncharacterized protein n=1 Tax=Penicillium bovifimosum TaxID=126998 RepID=A0A9W9L5D3_9EURO|nr:uncharacterized protein N7515_003072 [Penicillium bovifimosum]KAJ5138224.1 hypothetical protein N7515_003072 [Penicillium bovifimosum]
MRTYAQYVGNLPKKQYILSTALKDAAGLHNGYLDPSLEIAKGSKLIRWKLTDDKQVAVILVYYENGTVGPNVKRTYRFPFWLVDRFRNDSSVWNKTTSMYIRLISPSRQNMTEVIKWIMDAELYAG